MSWRSTIGKVGFTEVLVFMADPNYADNPEKIRKWVKDESVDTINFIY